MITVPIEVLSLIFDYFKNIDLIEASAVCKKWYEVEVFFKAERIS